MFIINCPIGLALPFLNFQGYEDCEQVMLQRGRTFLEALLEARGKVAKQALPFIGDGCVSCH